MTFEISYVILLSQEEIIMNIFESLRCPVCESKLRARRLACPECHAEYSTNEEFSAFDYLNKEQKSFLFTFIKSGGSIKAVGEELNVS